MADPSKLAQLDAIFGNLQTEMSNVGKGSDFYGFCAVCLSTISEQEHVTVGESKFHSQCFKCQTCQMDLRGKEFFFHEGKPVCQADFVAKTFTDICPGCNKSITDEVVDVQGKTYHPACFCCKLCSRELVGLRFIPHEGAFYCEEDFVNMNAPTCVRCQKKVVRTAQHTEVLKVGNDTFHRECFSCEVCNQVFADGKAFKFDNMLLCDTHYTLKKAGKI